MRRPELKFISEKNLEQLASVGIKTVRDLANADKYQVLRLRGQDFPQVKKEDRMDYLTICDAKALAEAVVDKCTVKDNIQFFDGSEVMPWTVKNVFGGAPPAVGSAADWHNVDYSGLYPETDPIKIVDTWDGCKPIPVINPNVNGLGVVDVVSTIVDPLYALEELFCRYTPGNNDMNISSQNMFQSLLY